MSHEAHAPKVELLAVERRFGGFSVAIERLAVDPGDYLVILGPSGGGKSLLLATIAGIYRPDRGKILLSGEEITDLPPERRGLGLVFQKASLFPHLSVAANIEFGLRMRGARRAERRERVDELVRTLGIESLLRRPVPALSGGEAQKVAIARALAPRPALLLLDEPLSLVDHNARIELQHQLRALHEETGITAMHVTHSRDEARALGRHCAVMLGGRIVQQGATAQVFESPRCLFVSRFLGHDGPVAQGPGCTEACLGGGRCDLPFAEKELVR